MKKTYKYSLIVVIGTAIVIYFIINLHRNTVVNNLIDKNKTVTSMWSELYMNSNIRLKLIDTLIRDNKIKSKVLDSLKIALKDIKQIENLYKKESSIEFVKKQYDLNKIYINVLKEYSNDSILKQNQSDKVLTKLEEADSKSNVLIDKYNDSALDYNKYISIFPNFYFAKSNGFHKRKYFTIKYGSENEDPIIESKRLPSWAKDQDTI
ncbi:LemA family protein [Flavobacterium branchiarum]|uniref:LemA family protein n=1 Tax=Flavobacterium branchiarum TaxID=1114870 RepID=A0ABV5FRM2_9FLAO|nr:LemA family protein [Flavobacterium branchiarum]MDN3673312.1 LemA family protein [Flavobacterium branchiarum]